MSLLTVKNLSQTFIDKTLYEDANFVLNKEDHMGVTGQNGVGKSTLIKILTGEITQLHPYGLLYLKQNLHLHITFYQ